VTFYFLLILVAIPDRSLASGVASLFQSRQRSQRPGFGMRGKDPLTVRSSRLVEGPIAKIVGHDGDYSGGTGGSPLEIRAAGFRKLIQNCLWPLDRLHATSFFLSFFSLGPAGRFSK